MDASTAETLLAFAEEVSPGITRPAARTSLERLEARSEDLLAAIGCFVDADRTDEALRLANSLYRYWITTQRFQEGAVWFDRVLGSPDGRDVRCHQAT
jgi:predicted ATPase